MTEAFGGTTEIEIRLVDPVSDPRDLDRQVIPLLPVVPRPQQLAASTVATRTRCGAGESDFSALERGESVRYRDSCGIAGSIGRTSPRRDCDGCRSQPLKQPGKPRAWRSLNESAFCIRQ